MRYRRYYRAGGTYFFTLVAHNRQPILTCDAVRSALREAVLTVREKYPFEITAWMLMPDHLHTIWHLPQNDADFPNVGSKSNGTASVGRILVSDKMVVITGMFNFIVMAHQCRIRESDLHLVSSVLVNSYNKGKTMRYRRYYRAGGTFFFTVVAHNRHPILTGDAVRSALREAVLAVREKYPFEIAAWVLMSDHLHAIWHLPENDADFSERWRQIKRHSQYLIGADTRLWQKRFWEHAIRDEADFARHFDYVHFNPVKHGHVSKVSDWPFSTFHRYIKQGIYPLNWGGNGSDFVVAYDS